MYVHSFNYDWCPCRVESMIYNGKRCLNCEARIFDNEMHCTDPACKIKVHEVVNSCPCDEVLATAPTKKKTVKQVKQKKPMWTDNPYYAPEKCGLEIVATIDYSSGSYEFDLRVVWRNLKNNVFYTARNAGCSCPSPFEDYTDIAMLETVDIATLEREVKQSASFGEATRFINEVQKAMLPKTVDPGRFGSTARDLEL